MNRVVSILLCLIATTLIHAAQDWWPVAMHTPDSARDTIMYQVALSAVASTGHSAPFWLYTNQQGNISESPFSGNITAGVYKRATRPSRWFDYDFGVALTGRFSPQHATGYFNDLYAHVRLYIVDITAGIHSFHAGSQDPFVSMGGLLFSNNAHPLPRISIGIDEYIPFPGLFGYMEIKGGVTHGWFADACCIDSTKATIGTLLHYKFAGVRLGGKLPINISYEFHHAAQWGGISPIYGVQSTSWQTYKNIFMADKGGNSLSDQLNAEGNHIGFQELAVSAKWDKWRITAYWQTLFEDMSAAFIGCKNQTDGLWGLSIRQDQWPFIQRVTYEFMNTTGQDGPWHDKDGLVYGGRSDYFNNSCYPQGWTYFGQTIGNPFIRPDNNRVRIHHIGLAGDIYGFNYRVMGSYGKYWGTYKHPKQYTNTSLLLEVTKEVKQAWGINFGLRLAADFGTLYGNHFGAMLTISKQGIIHSY